MIYLILYYSTPYDWQSVKSYETDKYEKYLMIKEQEINRIRNRDNPALTTSQGFYTNYGFYVKWSKGNSK